MGTRTVRAIAFMRDGITQAKITTKPRFENGDFRFYHELIAKAAMMKRMPTWKHHDENEGLRKCRANDRGLVGNFEHVIRNRA